MGETKVKRFLAKLGLVPPSKHDFYKAQQELAPKIEKYTRDLLSKLIF